MSRQLALGHWMQYPIWARGPSRIIEEEIILDEDRAERYYMNSVNLPKFGDDLVFELAHLAADLDNIDPRQVLAFVRRYGLLWHGAGELGNGECRESLVDMLYESKILAVLLQLYMNLKRSSRNGSIDALRGTVLEVADMLFGSADPEPNDQDLMAQASVYLAESITRKLEGCSMGITSPVLLDIEANDPNYFMISPRPPNLLSAAYLHFAHSIAARRLALECPGCDRVFIPESGKQKYCTKSCASTSRWRRWKDSQAE